jgi:hypothetical protein
MWRYILETIFPQRFSCVQCKWKLHMNALELFFIVVTLKLWANKLRGLKGLWANKFTGQVLKVCGLIK